MDRVIKLQQDIARLNKAELSRLHAYIKMRVGVGVAAPTPSAQSLITADTVLDVLVKVAGSRGIGTMSAGTARRRRDFKSFKEKVEEGGVGEFIQTAVKRNNVKAYALLHMSMDLFVDDLKEWSAAVNTVTMMNHIQRLPAILDKAFPGYAECGLLHMVIQEKEEDPDVREERSDETVSKRGRQSARKRNVLHDTRRRTRRG